MKKIISSLAMVAMVACGGGAKAVPTKGVSNSAEAAKLSGKTLSAMQSANTAARDISESVSVKCATSGSVDVKVTVSTDSSTAGQGTITFGAHDCIKVNAYEIDGTATYSYNANTTDANNISYSISLNGTVAVVIYNSDGSVDQSADVTYDNVKVTVTIATDSSKGCVTYTATGSGSIKIGGQTYTPSGTEWADAGFGGGSGSFSTCSN